MPEIARLGVLAIETQVPDYVRPHDARYSEVIQSAVEYSVGHWFDLIVDPEADSAEVVQFFYDLGVGEAREGRVSLEVWQTSARLATRATVDFISQRAPEEGLDVPGRVVGQITASVLAYIDVLAEAVSRGYTEASAREVGEFQGRRKRLLDLLLEPGPEPKEIRELAAKTDWALPQTVAVVAVLEREGTSPRRPALPSEVLVGLHLDQPCVLVPDPDGPGRRKMLEHGLKEWIAVAGPTVPLTEAARSRDWAGQGLGLAARGLVPTDDLVIATEHLPSLVILRQEDLVGQVAERRLGPLLSLRPRQRHVLARTLLACLESGFNATEVATRLHMHAQTIRYRVRQLEGLLGEGMYDPAQRLELHMVLHGWLTLNPEGAEED
ncbi:helix-turn-helix domain-containing protein [Actinocorallia longicatena]|uniref:PucR family transcriptional regulator n=1 Tax=Actinocorallia longicatena TaxID=111803 RepID=UPI0031DB0B46